MAWHLAAVNVALAKYEIDDKRMSPFMDGLERINKLADESAGSVWRLETDDGDATSLRVFDNPLTLINLSVWESVQTLRNFTYKSAHVEFMRRRREWFEPLEGLPVLAFWWIPAGTIPTVEESKDRLQRLQDHGPTQEAFTFREVFDPPTGIP